VFKQQRFSFCFRGLETIIEAVFEIIRGDPAE